MGRFAPSPSGPLHLGSLYTALASFLQAKASGGEWLVRIDDLDPERSRAVAADHIRRTLERYGLFWDRELIFQSQRGARYAAALARLRDAAVLYPCTCSRKALAVESGTSAYPGFCRHRSLAEPGPSYALRVRAPNTVISLTDRLQGPYAQDLAAEVGDFVVKRRDGAIAYHLATVLDDHDAGVTQVVRGVDLLPSTPRQIYLQQLLELTQPDYCHIPVLVDTDGAKLSKSTHATAVDHKNPGATLYRLLVWLEQHPPAALVHEPVGTILEWGIAAWRPDRLSRRTRVQVVNHPLTDSPDRSA